MFKQTPPLRAPLTTKRLALATCLLAMTLVCPHRVCAQGLGEPQAPGAGLGGLGGLGGAGPRPGPHGVPVDEGEARAVEAMVGFVTINARLAGAESVCEPPVAAMLQSCTRMTLANWNQVSGMAGFRDPVAALKLGNSTWLQAYAQARDKQSSLTSALSCAEIARDAAHAPVLSVCGPRTGIGGAGLPPPDGATTQPGQHGFKLQ